MANFVGARMLPLLITIGCLMPAYSWADDANYEMGAVFSSTTGAAPDIWEVLSGTLIDRHGGNIWWCQVVFKNETPKSQGCKSGTQLSAPTGSLHIAGPGMPARGQPYPFFVVDEQTGSVRFCTQQNCKPPFFCAHC